ncbi:putative nucleosidase [Xylariaceae sp. AK1471]|nr:putative nucleosidase [Xylariaceae sp. AK1471]
MSQLERIKVIVDTDIGTDPDDGLALAFLALHPRCDLLGVTIVSGDVRKRAAIAEILLRTCSPRASSIPIHCGRRDPLLEGLGQPYVQQYAYIEHLAHERARPYNTAIDFMRRTIRENPGEVVLLTIGPLSNAALLFALDPEIPSLCREVVSMCGKYFGEEEPKKESNIIIDHSAAGMVVKAKRPRHRFVGLDVTRKVTWQQDEYLLKFLNRLEGEVKLILDLLGREWLARKGRVTFHDPLAAAVIFEPGLCKWKTGRVTVDQKNGEVDFQIGEETDLVAAEVDVEAFFRYYLDVFTHLLK